MFELPEDSIVTLDEIAATLGEDCMQVLREAVSAYLEQHESLKAELAEALRQADSSETISHEEMIDRFERMKASHHEKQAA